jgi:hypothetical protein
MASVDLHEEAAPPAPVLQRMSEADFIAWAISNEVWAEWVDGEVVMINAVNTGHGRLVTFLNNLVGGFVNANDLGEVLNEPVLVRLSALPSARSPDLFVVGTDRRHLVVPQYFVLRRCARPDRGNRVPRQSPS